MIIVEIEALPNGAHRNQDVSLHGAPDGWAVVPAGLPVPDTFPFVHITVSDGVVTEMSAGVVPEPVPVEEVPTEEEKLRADVDFLALMTGVTL